jgi:hypothetical protein
MSKEQKTPVVSINIYVPKFLPLVSIARRERRTYQSRSRLCDSAGVPRASVPIVNVKVQASILHDLVIVEASPCCGNT